MMASATNADMVAGARGEFIFPFFIPAYDGMFAAAKLLEALARSGLKLSQVADQFEPIHIVQDRVSCSWGKKGGVMRRLIESTEGEDRQLVDGVKVWKNEREWVLIIPHSDKPYFVVTAEGRTEERARALMEEYLHAVERWRDEA